MDFELSDEQTLLKDSVERFIQDNYGGQRRHDLVNSDLGFSRENWALFAEMGWLGLPFSEDSGGFDGTPADVSVVMECLGGGLAVEPFVATVLLGGMLVDVAGSAAQKSEILPKVIAGEMHMAFAYAEPQSRYKLADVETTATRDGGGFVLNGRKTVVLNGAAADLIVVSARTSGSARDEAGISLFLVEQNAAGLTRKDFHTLDGGRASDLEFDKVRIDADGFLGPIGESYPLIEKIIDLAICAVSAEAVGAMRKANEITQEYVATRKQFGAAIGSNQVIQHRLVDMHVAAEEAKSMADMAAMRVSGSDDERRQAASAIKSKIGETGRFVGEQGIQLHGGIGMTDECAIGHYYKRLMTIDMLFGNKDFHLNRYADLT